MHSPDTQNKFIELRAQGHSFARIAADLGVVRMVTPVKDIPQDEYVNQVQEWNP